MILINTMLQFIHLQEEGVRNTCPKQFVTGTLCNNYCDKQSLEIKCYFDSQQQTSRYVTEAVENWCNADTELHALKLWVGYKIIIDGNCFTISDSRLQIVKSTY